jgi:hypothetical protein
MDSLKRVGASREVAVGVMGLGWFRLLEVLDLVDETSRSLVDSLAVADGPGGSAPR